jgi:ferredoxin
VDGKAKIVADLYCDGLGACLGECPTGALTIVEREAEEFDEEAVEEFLSSKPQEEPVEEATMACGCPSAQIQTLPPPASGQKSSKLSVQQSSVSALSHWPVQIRLVPPTAPFLKGADLLVAADCTPVAYPNFHHDFLQGKVVMVGCPKFDDFQDYIQKFADIFNTADIKSVQVVVMEVPCCQGLPVIVEKGLEMANKKIPTEKVVISAGGEVLNREKLAA